MKSANKLRSGNQLVLFLTIVHIITLMLVLPSAAFSSSVSLSWEPSNDSDLTGYKVYYQANSSVFPFKGTGATEGSAPIDVGNVTNTIINGLDPGGSYYFAVTVYNSNGLESVYSNVVEVANAYTLVYSAGTNGSVSGSTPQTVNSGASGSMVTAVANPGYHFASWSDGVTTAARTDVNVTSNISVTASFSSSSYTLAYSAGANGTLSGSTSQAVSSGMSGSLVTAIANPGYHFVSWSDGATSAARSDRNVTSNISVTANFAINSYTLAYSAGVNGTISGFTAQTVNSGLSGTQVTAVANPGYHFVSWSDGITSAARTDANVSSNISTTASFVNNSYTLSYSADANGTISGSTAQTVNLGLSGTQVTAVANPGYRFVSWSDGIMSAARTDANVTSNVSVKASFAVNSYTVNYSAGANGTISGSASQVVNYGASGTQVTAVANYGYRFVSWSDGVTTATRTEANVTSNISVTSLMVDNALPVIKSISLVRGSSTVTIKASATDNVGVVKMQLYVDNTLQLESPNGSLSCLWTVTYRGAHTITVKAYDAAGNVRSQSLSFYK